MEITFNLMKKVSVWLVVPQSCKVFLGSLIKTFKLDRISSFHFLKKHSECKFFDIRQPSDFCTHKQKGILLLPKLRSFKWIQGEYIEFIFRHQHNCVMFVRLNYKFYATFHWLSVGFSEFEPEFLCKPSPCIMCLLVQWKNHFISICVDQVRVNQLILHVEKYV